MKLDKKTIKFLDNFSKINPSIVIKEGNVLSTMSPSKTVLGKATIDQSFPSKFAIYDLSRFLATLSLFGDPEISFEEKRLVIKEGARSINYIYADEKVVIVPPEKDIVFPKAEIEFKLPGDVLTKTLQALSVLSLPEFVIYGDEEKVFVVAGDTKNWEGDTYRVEVGETTSSFKMVIKAENLKMLVKDYDVKVSIKGISYFHSEDVEYYIPVEKHSEFKKG